MQAASGIDLVAHGTVSDADTIRDTSVAQPLIVSAGVATLAALFDLAAALFDRMFDLERIEGGFGVEAHLPIGVVWRRIGGGTAFPEHRPKPERPECRDLIRAAPAAGRVSELRCRVGDAVRGGDVLVIMEAMESEEKQ